MSTIEDEKFELIQAYFEKFREGPPLWKIPDDEAVRLMKLAIQTGQPMRGLDPVLPDDTVM